MHMFTGAGSCTGNVIQVSQGGREVGGQHQKAWKVHRKVAGSTGWVVLPGVGDQRAKNSPVRLGGRKSTVPGLG